MITHEYIAGLFDGKGYISFNYTASGYLKCQIGVSIGCREVLEAIRAQYTEGEVYQKEGTNHKLCTLFISGTNAARFLTDIQPHCIVKREDIQMYFEWLKLPKALPRKMTDEVKQCREAFYQRFKQIRERQKTQGIVRHS